MNKFAALRPGSLLKKRLRHRFILANFVKFLSASILQNNLKKTTKTNILKKKQKIRELEREADTLKHNQIYTCDLLPKDWCADPALSSAYPDITTLLKLAALIPPSTAEVERSFSLMNLILAPLRKRLLPENLSHCMRICKFPRALSDFDYKEILQHWLLGEGTKSSSTRVCTRS